MVFLLGVLTSCQTCYDLEPEICYAPTLKQIQNLPSAFDKLSKEELCTEWGKELYVGLNFAHEMDFYRAITAFKRALFFIPARYKERRWQIEYHLVQCYYLGQRYQDAIEAFDKSDLKSVPTTFPAFRDLRLILYDSYFLTDQKDKSEGILQLLKENDLEIGENLKLSQALRMGDLTSAQNLAPTTSSEEKVRSFLEEYGNISKSPQTAYLLNGILPGAGYAYVGQRKAAATSFLINSLFIGATYYFFRNGNIPMGIILSSLETGWYVGGMNGAALATKEYNQHLYELNAKEVMIQEKLFPVLMLEASF